MTTEPSHNLLSEPLIPVRFRGGELRDLSLPGLLAALQVPGVESFPTLRPHQVHPWHAFLVQLAAIAIPRAGADTGPATPEIWTERLLALTDGAREPWCLIVPDLSKPAFFQPPVPEGNLKKFNKWPEGTPYPDEIDMLVTAKNHDVKQNRIVRPTASHWIFALSTTQTSDGFLGRGNYGIARMNGGFSSRPSIGFAPGVHPDERFRRDLLVLSSVRENIAAAFDYDARGGHHLLWLHPWDGEKPLSISSCDPYFIEVCRRIRLIQGDRILAVGAPSKTTRVDAAETKGRTGDPWNAIKQGEAGTSLTLTKSGFSYRLVHELLSGDSFSPGEALKLHDHDPEETWFVAGVLVRGQGKTEGFHERLIPVSKKVRRLLTSQEGRKSFGKLARAMIAEVSEVQNRALKPAILCLLQGAPDGLNLKDERAAGWLQRLETTVDEIFFAKLWDAIEEDLDADQAAETWAATVFELAEDLLYEAIDSLPIPESRLFRAIAVAEKIFFGRRKARLGSTRKEPEDAAVA